MKTNELTGAALDWAVAKCEGYKSDIDDGDIWLEHPEHYTCLRKYLPSIDWSQGGPIIEREKIELIIWQQGWSADYRDKDGCQSDGPTPLIAAMRCYVASKLGKEIDLPEELL
jgi:hypothetical protein